MNTKVYNDGRLVFLGTAERFLADNGFDSELGVELNKLQNQDNITFNFYHNGEWRIDRL